MSVQSISLVLDHSQSEGIARLVMISIANHDGDGGSWPSIATIAHEARTSERNAQRKVKELVELGELVVHRNDGGTRHTRADRRPNRYEITIDPDAVPAPLTDPEDGPTDGVTDASPRDPRRGDEAVTPSHEYGVTGGASRGDRAVSPEPSLTVQDPPTPTADSAGAVAGGCASHPGGRPGCRACGTTPRQLARAAARAAEERRRTEEQAAWHREQEAAAERRRAAEKAATVNLELARAAIAEARQQATSQPSTTTKSRAAR